MTILTIFNDKMGCLSQKATAITFDPPGLAEAKLIAHQLSITLIPLMPAAGLAAPQIGISKQIFVYSWDRSVENMEIVINPKIITFNEPFQSSWEACFSAIQPDDISQAAFVSRAPSLLVEYYNLKGQYIQKELEGFAAKVFQHEFDHLQGIVCVRKEKTEVKTFETQEKLANFMMLEKQKETTSYLKPNAFKCRL